MGIDRGPALPAARGGAALASLLVYREEKEEEEEEMIIASGALSVPVFVSVSRFLERR